jgi:hypothetical protein
LVAVTVAVAVVAVAAAVVVVVAVVAWVAAVVAWVAGVVPVVDTTMASVWVAAGARANASAPAPARDPAATAALTARTRRRARLRCSADPRRTIRPLTPDGVEGELGRFELRGFVMRATLVELRGSPLDVP